MPPRADEPRFLDAICETPHDDAPRLAYADWLEDQGDPRAEFIRVQCQLEVLELDDPERKPLEARERALLTQHGQTWLRHRPRAMGIQWGLHLDLWQRCERITHHFRRGFLSAGVVTSLYAWNREVPRLTERLASEWEIDARADDARPAPAALECGPWLSRVTTLTVHAQAARPVLASERLTNLQRLDLRGLRAAPIVPRDARLKRLAWNIHMAGDLGIWLRPPEFDDLRVLHLDGCEAHHLPALAESRQTQRLRELDLATGSRHDGPGGELRLGRMGRWPHLVRLRVAAQRLTDADVAAIQDWDCPGLERLSIESGAPGPSRPYVDLFRSPAMARLEFLRLRAQALGDEGVQALAESPYLTRLVYLELSECRLSELALARLADSPNLAGLRILNLSGNPLEEASARALVDSPRLKQAWLMVNWERMPGPVQAILTAGFRGRLAIPQF